MVMEPEMASEM